MSKSRPQDLTEIEACVFCRSGRFPHGSFRLPPYARPPKFVDAPGKPPEPSLTQQEFHMVRTEPDGIGPH